MIFIVNVIKSLILTLFCLAFLFLLNPASCLADFKILQLDELSIDYRNYTLINPKARNILLYPDPPKEAVNVNINTSLLKFGYFNSIIESLTTDSQYRTIGLQVFLGIRISKYADLGLWHRSQHYLDGQFVSIPKFPSEDALQVKLYLYKRQKQDTIF